MVTFDNLLTKYRNTAFSEKDKGTRFEKLMRGFMQTYSVYRNLFDKVWLWNEFPFRDAFGGQDVGIDIVAKTKEGDYWAVQCKCYQESACIDKPAVDSFLSTSSKSFEDENGQTRQFAQRLWISTTNNWNDKAEISITNQNPPVSRINLTNLQEAAVDWEKLDEGIFGEVAINSSREPLEHQKKAIQSAATHFASHDRGKMIMACGTGKTYTSLKIAEKQTDGHGLILFLVPSIALLGQTLNEWSTFAKKPLNAICVCSDASASSLRRKDEDTDEINTVDLALPATTNINKIIKRLQDAIAKTKANPNDTGMTVVFSTYQSLEVVCNAQRTIMENITLDEDSKSDFIFDYIICDEAHRTTGVEDKKSSDKSPFLIVHKNENIKGHHRLYMTATPRLYTASSKKKAEEGGIELCSMDDESIYGQEFYRIGFGEAVAKNLLADYKVLVLTISDDQIPASLQEAISDKKEEINTDDASKLVGCINALSKQIIGDDGSLKEVDPQPMHTALAFCSRISDSRKIMEILNKYKDVYYESLSDEKRAKTVNVSVRHVDGSMGSAKRDGELSWLKNTPRDGMDCRIITNVRCLSEGVDVPALDAVLFLSARKSQVDVVQSVGRVMRVAHKSGKKYGYIIIPVIVPVNKKPEEALNENKNFDVVWSVLNALRAHDDRFNAEINKIELNKKKSKRIIVGTSDNWGNKDDGGETTTTDGPPFEQTLLGFEELQDAIYARLVKKVGSVRYWDEWAEDIADIAARHKARIEMLISTEKTYKEAFERFVQGLQKNLNPSLGKEDAIEMLAQHIITRPVFEALFEDYNFVNNNVVSQSMQKILNLLDKDGMEKDREHLEKFYASVKERCEGVDNAEGKQKIIIELYEKFFKVALPKTVGKLGIVYTPVEIVDFILHSVNDVLKKEFNRNLSDENVHILDPFTGTGTFITRLIQSGIIKNKDLERKYAKELHANEMVLLAYYIASINIENAFHDAIKSDKYIEFNGICLTDTFRLSEDESLFSEIFPQNSERVRNQQKTPIRVIVGNPPYSVGQSSANDNAQNERYPQLEARLAATYVAKTNATNKNSLYDSYIKAFRWASDRIEEEQGGVIGFVSNAGWLDGSAMDGMRACLESEFTSIYIFNLRGNQRTRGEMSRREGGKIFGSGSRTPVSITILVKNPKLEKEKGDIFCYNVEDYLSREEKLSLVADFKSCMSRKFTDALTVLKPNEHNDWLNQRNGVFENFVALGDKKDKATNKATVFCDYYGRGVATARDTWCYNFSKPALAHNMQVTIGYYNEQLEQMKDNNSEGNYEPEYDVHKISWTEGTLDNLRRGREYQFRDVRIVSALYRPFCRQYLYYDGWLNERTYQMRKSLPTGNEKNLLICTPGIGVTKEFSVFITDKITDVQFQQNGQCFPLYYYDKQETIQGTLFDEKKEEYIRRDGITNFIFNQAKKLYGDRVTKEDIFYYVYGFLHLPKYRTDFAADLKKSLPRIMLVKTPKVFWQISKAGRDLANIHLNYEKQPPTEGVVVEGAEKGNFTVHKLRFKNKEDKSVLIYNGDITIKNIPDEAHAYIINGRSPLEWIIDRYQVKIDKDSGIKNDCNKWGEEHGNPRYILDLILSCITVAIKTQEIVKRLPNIDFT